MRHLTPWMLLGATWLLCGPALAQQPEWSGYVSVEPRYFPNAPLFPEQPPAGVSPSAVLAPEFRFDWNQGEDRVTLVPFLRYDADDANRSHFDLREANWRRFIGPTQMLAGVGKVFWGVTESRHLVDIVNQTDLVEDIDEEDKLGQPMLLLERWTSSGTFTGILLPGFRERTFPARDARLSGAIPVDTEWVLYESGARNRRVDFALRWSQTAGKWDVGVAGFYGTSREPRFLPSLDEQGQPIYSPLYEVIAQIGVDAQYTSGAWLWKLETIGRSASEYSFGALVGGFEYTLYGLGESAADLGVLVEYLYDGRGPNAPPTAYDDDLFLGLRLAQNDSQDSAVLAGIFMDRGDRILFVEAERRLGSAWKLELEARLFEGIEPSDPLLRGLRRDSFLTLRLARYL